MEEEAGLAQGKMQIISQRQTEKDSIRGELGDQKYQELYDCLVYHRS